MIYYHSLHTARCTDLQELFASLNLAVITLCCRVLVLYQALGYFHNASSYIFEKYVASVNFLQEVLIMCKRGTFQGPYSAFRVLALLGEQHDHS